MKYLAIITLALALAGCAVDRSGGFDPHVAGRPLPPIAAGGG